MDIIFKVVLPVSYICMKVLGIFMDFVLAVAITETKDAANLKSLNLTNLDLSQVNKAIDLNAIAAQKSAQERFHQKDVPSMSNVIVLPTSLPRHLLSEYLSIIAPFRKYHFENLSKRLGKYLTESFGYRTCVQPNLVNELGSTWITYNIQSANIKAYSDENRKCLNEIELTYIILMAFTFTIGLGRDLIPQLTTCTVLDLSYKDSRIPFKVAVYVLLTRFRTEVVSLFHRKNKWYTMFDVSGKLASDYESALKDPEWPKKLYKAECDAYKGFFHK